MDPRWAGALAEGGVPFIAGLVFTLYGYRVIGKKPGEDGEYDARYRRYMSWFKWGGPLLMLGGVVLAILNVVRP